MAKILKFLLLALGFYILYLTVRSVGLDEIASNITSLKWKLLPLLFIYPFVFAFDTLGWAYAFPKSGLLKKPGISHGLAFFELYRIRIIGETLNCIIPWAASLGGEPVKAELVKRRFGASLSEGYASILIVHTTFWLSLNLFVIGGILVTLESLPLTPVLWQSVVAFLVGLGLLALLLVIGLHFGVFKHIHNLGEFFKWWGKDSAEKKLKYLELDNQIQKFYTKNPRRFVLSVLFNFLGWFAGVLETYWIARILDIPVGFNEAWLLEALVQVLRIVTFFIPSSIGAQEGGIVLIFLQFGFAKPVGLMFALVRRIREILWLGFGLFLWAFVEDKPTLKTKTSEDPKGA